MVVFAEDPAGHVYEVLIDFISLHSQSSPNEGLLQEIELFCQTQTPMEVE